MSYHVESPRFKELPEQLIVREDGYMDAHKNEGEPIVDYVYTLNGGDDKSRYAELFGTSERAARTMAGKCSDCCECVIAGYCKYGIDEGCLLSYAGNYDALLEWLRGDA